MFSSSSSFPVPHICLSTAHFSTFCSRKGYARLFATLEVCKSGSKDCKDNSDGCVHDILIIFEACKSLSNVFLVIHEFVHAGNIMDNVEHFDRIAVQSHVFISFDVGQ